MQEQELIHSIRTIWLEKVTQALALEEGVRENLALLLEQFYSHLETAVAEKDPTLIDPTIELWANSLTETDVEGQPNHLTQILKEILLLTQKVCKETLAAEDALVYMDLVLPCFAFGFERSTELEVQLRIKSASKELETMRDSMEKLDRSKSNFISVAAHELKTPLTLIEGYATMLDEAFKKCPDERINEKDLLKGIHHGTNRLKVIVDDMIDVSLIDNDLLRLNFQPVWLNRLFSVLETESRSVLAERNLELIINPFDGSNDVIYGEPERLLQVFRNILSNAVKFTPNGGKITIDGRKLPGFVEVTIADTGIGINPEDYSFIFEKFGRLGNIATHSSGKTKFKGGGPGLGLHIAKGIVETHGGTIWVESQGHNEILNPGSIFHILLPIKAEPVDENILKLFSTLSNK